MTPIFFLAAKKLASLSHKELAQAAAAFQEWSIKPNGTESYRTLGGVDFDALSSKTSEVNGVKGLYFIGEAVDVSGWLGGYNFQFA